MDAPSNEYTFHYPEELMSRFGCQCGEVISTSQYPNSVEGWLYGCEALEEFDQEIAKALSSFLAVKTQEERRRWLALFFSEDYPTDVEDSVIIADITSRLQSPYLRDVLECPSCGRLHIQVKPGENVWRTYQPEDGANPGILKNNKSDLPQ